MEILTLGNKVQRTGSFIPEWLALSIAWLIALTWASSVENVYAQQYQPAFDAQPAYQLMQPSQGPPGAWTEPAEAQNPIRLVQSTSNYDKPLHPMIEKMPDIEDELEVIHHRSQLIVARSNVLRTAISDTSVIDVVPYSPNEIAILGLNRGSTTLTVWFEDNPDPVVFLVKVVRDPSLEEQRRVDFGKLEQKLAVLFPNSRVYLIPLSYKIIVRGQARDAEEAAQILQIVRGEVLNQDGGLYNGQDDAGGNAVTAALADIAGGAGGGGGGGDNYGAGNGLNNFASSLIVNMLEVPGEFQVMLHVKIAELNRSMLRRLGVDFNAFFDDGATSIGWIAGGAPATLTGLFENGEISVLINALAGNGSVKIVSQPTLTCISGHQASFIAGGEFAVPTIIGVGGAQGTSTTFRGFGTSLFVTPTVIDKDLIRMRITPEYSQTTEENSVAGIPGLSTRRVSTTVQMREGQTIVLAGLFSYESSTQNNRIPMLGDIPWVGPWLFNAKRATNDETELLILVTPELVRPMEADEVPPMPGHYVTLPNDPELYRHAMTEGAPDTEVYQLAPYGSGSGTGVPVGYHQFNPGPSQAGYEPAQGSPVSSSNRYSSPYGPNHSPATAIPGVGSPQGWRQENPQGMRPEMQQGWRQEYPQGMRPETPQGWRQEGAARSPGSSMAPRMMPARPAGNGRPPMNAPAAVNPQSNRYRQPSHIRPASANGYPMTRKPVPQQNYSTASPQRMPSPASVNNRVPLQEPQQQNGVTPASYSEPYQYPARTPAQGQ